MYHILICYNWRNTNSEMNDGRIMLVQFPVIVNCDSLAPSQNACCEKRPVKTVTVSI